MNRSLTASELHALYNELRANGCRATVLARVEREYSEALVREWNDGMHMQDSCLILGTIVRKEIT